MSPVRVFYGLRAAVDSRWRAKSVFVPPWVLGGAQRVSSCHRGFSMARKERSRAAVGSRWRARSVLVPPSVTSGCHSASSCNKINLSKQFRECIIYEENER